MYNENLLIGFYILNTSAKCVDVSYLYFEPDYERKVYLSIAEHIMHFDTLKVLMADERLCAFIQQYHLYAKLGKRMKSFSYPQGFVYDKTKTLQSGDGDNLT